MVIITENLLIADGDDIFTNRTVGSSFLCITTNQQSYKTAGEALIQIVIHTEFSVHQDHLTWSGEEVNVVVNSSQLVKVIVGLAVSLITRRVLADCLNNRVSTHLGITQNTHGDHLSSLLLN